MLSLDAIAVDVGAGVDCAVPVASRDMFAIGKLRSAQGIAADVGVTAATRTVVTLIAVDVGCWICVGVGVGGNEGNLDPVDRDPELSRSFNSVACAAGLSAGFAGALRPDGGESVCSLLPVLSAVLVGAPLAETWALLHLSA